MFFGEMNQIADHLSKDGILLGDGEWKKRELQIDTIMDDDPSPISS